MLDSYSYGILESKFKIPNSNQVSSCDQKKKITTENFVIRLCFMENSNGIFIDSYHNLNKSINMNDYGIKLMNEIPFQFANQFTDKIL